MPEVQLDRRRCFHRGPLGSSFPVTRLAGDLEQARTLAS
ncbi:uncharacterized protein METZ01_LOCUS11393 [marine metagenome]|uniref:Uncharacterized protein n=1 Tax=marine metagenome TaxID=408172 RepID=A0A381NWF2_9ZZZZ